MDVLIDTNVVLDALVSREPFSEAAQKIFLLAAEDEINAFLTANSVADVYYLLHKYLHRKSGCRETLIKLFALFDILDVTASDCKNALELEMSDYEDALLASCAKRKRMDCIVTRNLKDFVKSPVKAISPDDFISVFYEQK